MANAQQILSAHRLSFRTFFQNAREKLTDKSNLFVLICIVVYVGVQSAFTISKHIAFNTYAWDLGVYDQSLWSTLNLGRLFWNSPNWGHFHIHFEPVLFLALPIYRLFEDPVTLLFLQSLLLGLSALPLYLLAQDILKSKTRAAVFALLYLANPVLISVNLFDFHSEAFMPLFLLSSLYFYRKENWSGYFLFLILALTTKETVSLITLFFGVYLFLARGKLLIKSGLKNLIPDKIFLAGVATIVLSLAWFYISSQVITYFVLNSPHQVFGYRYLHAVWWSDFGKDPTSIIIGVFTNPQLTVSHLGWLANEKILLIAAYLVPLFFMPLFEPWILAVPIPWVTLLFLSSNPWYWRLGIYYPAPVIPFVFLAAIIGIKKAARDSVRNVKRIQYGMMISTLLMSLFLISPFIGTNPPNPQVSALHNQALVSTIDLIPLSGSIITQNNLFPHVSHRSQVYPGYAPDLAFDYVLMDMTDKFYMENVSSPMSLYKPIGQVLPDLWNTGNWSVVTATDGIVLLKRNYGGQFVPLIENGLIAEFFNNDQFAGDPAFRTVVFSLDWNETVVPVTWDRAVYTEIVTPFVNVHDGHYSVLYEGYLTAPTTGSYTFQFVSKNRPNLYIDNTVVLNGSEANASEYSAQIQLTEGKHKVRIEQIVNGEGEIQLYWQTPLNTKLEIVPADYLRLESD